MSFRYLIAKVAPWLITLIALVIAFRGVNWDVLLLHLGEAKVPWLAAALILTLASYFLRSWRWQALFPEHSIAFWNAMQVLILGFFMNNILPARAGEFVRAHMGARLTGKKRTLVLATIASERLVDGLTISLFFVVFAFGLGDSGLSSNLLIVAVFFGLAGLAVIAAIIMRQRIFGIAERVAYRINHKASHYTFDRFQVFLNGLTPLLSPRKLPLLIIYSLCIWGVELAVYRAVVLAYSADLSLAYCVLFMVAINFSSLIPAAPGGIGVIEAIGTAVLVSIGIEKEHALTMVISQHAIQYLVVGIPGALIMLNWKKTLEQVQKASEDENGEADPDRNNEVA